MKGLDGLRPLELGQSAAKAIGDDAKKNLKIAQSQITGQPVRTQANANPMQQPQAPDAMGDMGKLLETNQTKQDPFANASQQNPQQPQVNLQEKYAGQQKKDQAELEAARKNIQQIEQEMEKHRNARKQRDEQEEVKEEQEQEQEELWKKEEEKKMPINSGERSGEIKGNKG